jgi:hypothetical protein
MDGNFTKVHIDTPQSLLDWALFFAQGIAYFLRVAPRGMRNVLRCHASPSDRLCAGNGPLK